MDTERPSKDRYWMDIAKAVAARGTCKRLKVGAVLVKNNRILSSGYNGAPEGLQHCLEIGCLMENGHCIRTVHAEANAIIQAGYAGGLGTVDSTLYTTASPCANCMNLIINAGIKRVVYAKRYESSTPDRDSAHEIDWNKKRVSIQMVHLQGC